MQKSKVHAPEGRLKGSLAEDLRIQPMKLEDLNDVLKIERASFVSPWSRKYFLMELTRNPLSHLFILRERASDTLAGFVVCWILQEQVHINNLAVAPGWRNRGCGEILMRKAISLGLENHCHVAVLEVRTSNQAALGLYRKLGFVVVGEIPGYYANGENAFVLSLQIEGSP